MTTSYTAAAQLVKAVGDFAQRQPDWGECIVYETKPDERWDVTLVSQRVYGTRDEFLTIMAAAGLDSFEQQMSERRLVLPTARQLVLMKTNAGIATNRYVRPQELSASPILAR